MFISEISAAVLSSLLMAHCRSQSYLQREPSQGMAAINKIETVNTITAGVRSKCAFVTFVTFTNVHCSAVKYVRLSDIQPMYVHRYDHDSLN